MKIIVLITALLAVGLLVLPQTVTLFAGEHYWYNLSGSGNDVPCKKCHADIGEELTISGIHSSMDCDCCHRTDNATGGYAADLSGTVEPGVGAHAASTVECMLCHDGASQNTTPSTNFTHYYMANSSCGQCHDPPTYTPAPAGGLNLTVNASDTGSEAAHLAFVQRASESDLLRGENEACIACHTASPVKINWSHARSLEFRAGLGDPVTTDTGVHNWTFTSWSCNGTANSTVFGNTTGNGSTTSWADWPGNVGNIYN